MAHNPLVYVPNGICVRGAYVHECGFGAVFGSSLPSIRKPRSVSVTGCASEARKTGFRRGATLPGQSPIGKINPAVWALRNGVSGRQNPAYRAEASAVSR